MTGEQPTQETLFGETKDQTDWQSDQERELTVAQKALVEEVAVAFADTAGGEYSFEHDRRCLMFLTSGWFEEFGALYRALSQIGRYEMFGPAKTMRRLQQLGGGVRVAVGREYGPVLYVECSDKGRVRAAMKGEQTRVQVEVDEMGLARNYREAAHDVCDHATTPVEVKDMARPDPDRDVVRISW
jgi:hypothetical protein